jgi:hypothetical protein
VDKVHKRGYVFHFVALEVPDKMPADIFWQRLCFFGKFLDVVLAKISLSGVKGFHQQGGGFGLAHRDKSYVRRKEFKKPGNIFGNSHGREYWCKFTELAVLWMPAVDLM